MNALRNACGMFAAAAVLMSAGSASAAVIAGYNFGATTSSVTRAATTKDANVTATEIAGGGQTIFLNQNGTNYTSFPFRAVSKNGTAGSDNGMGGVTGTPTGAIDRSQFYVEYTVTAAAGYELDLSSATFQGSQGGGAAGERKYAIHTSVDGLPLTTNSDITSGNAIQSGAFTTVRPANGAPGITMPEFGADLTAAKYQNLSSFTFRVYLETLNNGQNIDVDNFVLNGTVSAVPEPASIAAIAGAGLVALRRRRRA